MIVIILIAIVVFVLIKFLFNNSKSENKIESNDIRVRFKPFIDVVVNSYKELGIDAKIADIDNDKRAVVIQTDYLSENKDKINHFLMIKGDIFHIEITYFILSLKFRKVYDLQISNMDNYFQKINSQKIIKDFEILRNEFQSENEALIMEEMVNKFLYK